MRTKIPAIAFLGLLLSFSVLAGADAKKDCHIGTYRLSDGRTVDVAPSDGNTLRWRTFTGETGQLHPQANGTWTSTYGWTERPDGKTISFSDCDQGELMFGNDPGRRIALDVHATVFRIPFRYEPMPTLRASNTPQLWVLGSDDLEAPSAETAKRIKSLIAQDKDYTLAVYPRAEHGMTEYELNARGERVSTRFSQGYFQMMADFIRGGRIGEHYGNAQITQPVYARVRRE